jgi:cell fate (sporulation/competence/biofilm development) regulator YlbF (YheA/YmcA/DUF963 family)
VSVNYQERGLMYEIADHIADEIQSSEAAARFWQAREKMERHQGAKDLFEELKRKTNNSYVLRDILSESHPKYHDARSQIMTLEEQLAEIPVAMQYKEAQDELNSLMQEVVQLILRRLSRVIPVEPGPKQGCGKACTCGDH